MRKDLTSRERQLVLDYGLRNLQKGPEGGGDEIDGWLVLECGTINFWRASSKLIKQLYKVFGTARSNPIIMVILMCVHCFPANS